MIDSSAATDTDSNPIKLFGHASCPQLPPVIGQLKVASVPYEYINIHRDDNARQLVREINNGYESVPTLIFPDGTTLTEPSARELTHKLEALGYTIPWTARIMGNMFQIVMGLIILWAALRFLEVL